MTIVNSLASAALKEFKKTSATFSRCSIMLASFWTVGISIKVGGPESILNQL
jgi:hypothetical protein